MAKMRISALEIQKKINNRLASSKDLDGDCKDCRVPIPRQADSKDYGSNWHIDSISNCVGGCIAVAADAIVREVRQNYDSNDWP